MHQHRHSYKRKTHRHTLKKSSSEIEYSQLEIQVHAIENEYNAFVKDLEKEIKYLKHKLFQDKEAGKSKAILHDTKSQIGKAKRRILKEEVLAKKRSKIVRKKNTVERKKTRRQAQRLKQARKEIEPLEVELIHAKRHNAPKIMLTEMQSEIDKKKRKILARGPGFQKKKERRSEHREALKKSNLLAAFNEARRQRHVRDYAPKESECIHTPKVIDLLHIQSQQAEYQANCLRRNFSKLRKFLDRGNADSITIFLKILNDSGVKTIPTDLFFGHKDFEEIVLILLIEHGVTDLPIRKYQQMA